MSNDFPKIFNYGDVYLGLTGLATDVITVFVLSVLSLQGGGQHADDGLTNLREKLRALPL